MAKRRFSRPPQVGSQSRPSKRVDPDLLSPEIQEFKNTYILERRVLERFRSGDVTPYQPAPSLDGKSKFDSPEERTGQNQWVLAYRKLSQVQKDVSPTRFVRLLFKILRGSSLAIPTIKQLATPGTLELVADCLRGVQIEVRAQLVSEAQRAKSAITLHQKAGSSPLALAVYYAVVDSRLELSPLFKYCLAVTTVEQIRKHNDDNSHCDKLENLAKQYEFMAVMDYTLFADLYDEVWRDAIPDGLRVAAKSFMAAAVEQ